MREWSRAGERRGAVGREACGEREKRLGNAGGEGADDGDAEDEAADHVHAVFSRADVDGGGQRQERWSSWRTRIIDAAAAQASYPRRTGRCRHPIMGVHSHRMPLLAHGKRDGG